MIDSIRETLGVKPPTESVEFLNLLIYGDPGSGKTFLAGTAQDDKATKPALIVDLEGGVVTLRNRPDIDVVQVRSMKQLEEVFNTLVKTNEGYYKTVALDSLTELQKLDMRTVMQEQFAKKPENTDLYVPSQREWGKSGERMRLIVRKFRDLQCHTIMTCLMAYDKDDKTGKTSYFPALPGKLKSELPGFFDIVGMLRAIGQKEGDEVVITRYLQVASTDSVMAKDRTAALGMSVEDPSIPKLWELITQANGNLTLNTGKGKGNK